MKRDKIRKVMMSAAVMMSVTAIPSWAEEYREEPETYGAKEEETLECSDECEEEGAFEERKGPGEIYETELEMETEESEEAQYQAHEGLSGGPGVVEWTRKETEETTEYGPHCVGLVSEESGEEEAAPLYTDEELYILAHAICGEGQCCPDEEQLYIGSVILNRKNHGAYPNTIEGVVFQRGQYACTWDGNYYREPTEANWRNARWLLENGSILPGNVVYQAGFRQGSGMYLQTRYHKYCYR